MSASQPGNGWWLARVRRIAVTSRPTARQSERDTTATSALGNANAIAPIQSSGGARWMLAADIIKGTAQPRLPSMDDLRTYALTALLGLAFAFGIIRSLGCDGSVGGFRVGPSTCWLRVAGK